MKHRPPCLRSTITKMGIDHGHAATLRHHESKLREIHVSPGRAGSIVAKKGGTIVAIWKCYEISESLALFSIRILNESSGFG